MREVGEAKEKTLAPLMGVEGNDVPKAEGLWMTEWERGWLQNKAPNPEKSPNPAPPPSPFRADQSVAGLGAQNPLPLQGAREKNAPLEIPPDPR